MFRNIAGLIRPNFFFFSSSFLYKQPFRILVNHSSLLSLSDLSTKQQKLLDYKNQLFFISVLEYCSEEARIIPLWTVMLSYSMSSILTPVMSMYLSSWRALLLIATFPNFIVLIADFFHLIPESLRWLLCKGRKELANKLVYKIAKFNRVQLNVSCNRQKK